MLQRHGRKEAESELQRMEEKESIIEKEWCDKKNDATTFSGIEAEK